MLTGNLLVLAAGFATAAAQSKGFNYGSTFTSGAPKMQADFESEFKTAQGLNGASGFNSARLYTMIQAGTSNSPISAIPAAISTKTTLLLGLWASGGQDVFNNELAALSSAIQQYGSSFTDLIVGISVGSEDLYRISPTGILNKSGIGANPSTIVDYINQLRKSISGTPASSKPIGHVDTWNDWANSSNSAVVNAVDFVGMDAYAYFEATLANSIDNGRTRFTDALGATKGAAGSKPVWVTETGWPISGPTSNQAVASVDNAKRYWNEVGCGLLFGKVNTWWFTLQDSAPDTPSPSFGLVGSKLTTTPIYDLTCSAASQQSGSSSGSSGSSSGSSSSPSSGSAAGSNSAGSSAAISSATGGASSPSGTAATRPVTTLTSTAAARSSSGAVGTPTGGSRTASASAGPSTASSGATSVRPGPFAQFVISVLMFLL